MKEEGDLYLPCHYHVRSCMHGWWGTADRWLLSLTLCLTIAAENTRPSLSTLIKSLFIFIIILVSLALILLADLSAWQS